MDKPAEQTELRILLLEDVATDAELIQCALHESGLSFTARCVATEETFVRALEEFKPDIVLSDYRLPTFDGISAVKFIRQHYPSVPVIMVTGALGDETAAELLKLGARDYILKDRLSRLGIAVRRALAEERDIRARKAAMQSMRESEEKFRIIFESALDGILVVDAKTRQFVDGNPEICRMLGYNHQEITRLGIADIHPQQDLPHVIEQFESRLRGKILLAADIPVKRKDGSVFYADINTSPVIYGGRSYLIGFFHDVTPRKLAAEQLAESEQHFRAVTESASDAIITADSAGNIITWNAAAERLFGYTQAETGKQSLTILMPECFRAAHSAGLMRVVSGGAPHVIGRTVEVFGLRKDGGEFPLELSLAQWRSGDNLRFTAIIRDITERKRTESRLAEQLDKLRRWHDATLGREMRIIELKREVNQLLGQAGQAPRYPSAESD